MIMLLRRVFCNPDFDNGDMAAEKVRRSWKTYLNKAGWEFLTVNAPKVAVASDLICCKANTVIAIHCSGTGRGFRSTQVWDLVSACLGKGMTPVFALGEAFPDKSALQEVSNRKAVAIRAHNFDSLEGALKQLPPRLAGSVDLVNRTGIIAGWARVSPAIQQVHVEAFLSGEKLGKTVANIFRKDLSGIGDGCYGFKIKTRDLRGEDDGFMDYLQVRGLVGGENVGRVNIWDKVVII